MPSNRLIHHGHIKSEYDYFNDDGCFYDTPMILRSFLVEMCDILALLLLMRRAGL